jgi:hypothetical protein
VHNTTTINTTDTTTITTTTITTTNNNHIISALFILATRKRMQIFTIRYYPVYRNTSLFFSGRAQHF